MVEVGGTVEQFYFADRSDGGDDLVYHIRSPRFGEVGDTFDELGHGIYDISTGSIQVYDFGFSTLDLLLQDNYKAIAYLFGQAYNNRT